LAQIFPKWTLKVPLYAAAALPIVGAAVVGGIWYYFSPEYTDVGYRPAQPVPYSHALHVGEFASTAATATPQSKSRRCRTFPPPRCA